MSKRKRYFESKYAVEDDVVDVAVDQIFVSAKNLERVKRDETQIKKMRREFEYGHKMVPVILRHRAGGGYLVEDGRHRVIAAKLCGFAYIEARIVA